MGERAAGGAALGGARAGAQSGSWVERLARAGYAAKGIVHILVGGMAAYAAIEGGRAEGSRDALRSLAGETGGTILLGLIAVGLAGYVVWRFVEATVNPEDDGAGKRVLFVISGIIYGGLALEAGRLALGESGSGAGGGNDWTADLMANTWGMWLVGLAGAAIAGYGLYQLYKAYSAKLGDELDLGRLGHAGRTWTRRFGRFGLAARGVVLGIIGALVIGAAVNADPQQASSGLGEALETLENQPYGPWLLAVVALGLAAYGVFLLVKAKYRRFRG